MRIYISHPQIRRVCLKTTIFIKYSQQWIYYWNWIMWFYVSKLDEKISAGRSGRFVMTFAEIELRKRGRWNYLLISLCTNT